MDSVWDQILQESQAARESMKGSVSLPGRQRLPLNIQARRQVLLMIARSVAEIAPSLTTVIQQLADGDLPWPLFLHGPAGTGKTCAALCLLDHAGGEYFSNVGLCQKVIQSQQGRLSWSKDGYGGTIWPEQFWKALAAFPLVILDDLGSHQKVTDHHYDCVKQLLDERQGRPLVVTSNFDLSAVSLRYDDRIASRLAAGTVVKLEGKDRRVNR